MSLKLFRSTGYSSILAPGETRLPLHPGWMIAAISAWAGFACNFELWRQLWSLPADSAGLVHALMTGSAVAGACALVLSVLGWRKTFKPAGTIILLLTALASCAIWTQGLPVDESLLDKRLSSLIFPSWTSLLRWQVPVILAGLALVPIVWMWHANVRRLPGPQQLSVNNSGMLTGGALLVVSGFLLHRGLV